MECLTVLAGVDKTGEKESYEKIEMHLSEIIAIVGNTGSGKSRFIKDIEQLANEDTVSKRKILVDNEAICKNERMDYRNIAHLGQNMRFVLDITVDEFVSLHNQCRDKNVGVVEVLTMANSITHEPIDRHTQLNLLSGGQTRALMIADIALICDSPIVLVDEIENAGVDKIRALECLKVSGKLILIVTHDTHTALMGDKRIIMKNGGVYKVLSRTAEEKKLYEKMSREYQKQAEMQMLLRKGESIG